MSTTGSSRMATAITIWLTLGVGRRAATRPLFTTRLGVMSSPARTAAIVSTLAAALSRSSDTSRAIAVGLALTGVLLARRRDWTAAAPALAMSMASATHVVSSTLVGRERPGVERFGTVQPTSSFPSGHVGAMTALAVVIGRIAEPLPRPVKVAVRTTLVAYLG